MSIEIAIIAAMKREIRALVRGWSRREIIHGDIVFPGFQHDGVLVVCSGVGGQLARQAAVAVFGSEHPSVVVSAGLAGALDSHLHVGQVCRPAVIVDLNTGARFGVPGGRGVLVSASSVLDRDAKRRIIGSYAAEAADMEAASVALVADQHGCPFVALKAISDEAGFDMPSFEGFIDARGRIRMARLMIASTIHPGRLARLLRLGRNTARASQELSRALAHLIEKQGAVRQPALSGRTT